MKLTFGRDGMFALELKLEGFVSKDASGRKSYTKGRVVKWNVEYGSLTLALLVKHLSTELNLCTNQTPTIWFYDKRLNEDTRLADDHLSSICIHNHLFMLSLAIVIQLLLQLSYNFKDKHKHTGLAN